MVPTFVLPWFKQMFVAVCRVDVMICADPFALIPQGRSVGAMITEARELAILKSPKMLKAIGYKSCPFLMDETTLTFSLFFHPFPPPKKKKTITRDITRDS